MNPSLDAASMPHYHHQQQQQPTHRNPSPAVNAYLQHLQSKKGMVSGTDQRQTITSPTARSKVSLRQQPLQPSPSSTISIPNADMKKNARNHVLTKTLPRSSPTNIASTPQGGKHRHKSTGKKSKKATKPPLGGHHKHPRSSISDATNSTYLSSDSDEDASTATATVHSDGTGSFHSGPSSVSGSGNRRNRKSRTDEYLAGSSPRNNNIPSDLNSVNALVPYQPNEPCSNSTYTHDFVADDDAYATDNNGSNYYFTDQMPRQHYRARSDALIERQGRHEDTEEFSYSDEDDYYYHHQQQQLTHQNDANIDEHSYGDNDEDDTLAVDLDQLIEEASARWKVAVSETVQSTSTTAAFVSQTMGLSAATPFVSPLLQRQFSDISRAPVAPMIGSEHVHVVPMNGSSPFGSVPGIVIPAPTSSSTQIIHEQQNEIEALRAELQRHQQHLAQPPMNVVEPQVSRIHHVHPQQEPPQPVHPIQVLTVAADHNCAVDDDLTVWSGFQSMSAPPLQRRPDADVGSVTGETNHVRSLPHPSANKATRQQQPPRPPSSTTQTIRLELSSIVTGITRSAIFTGKVTSENVPTSDSFTTMSNRSITGTGVLQFVETGDVYRGDIVHSEMHGNGTYTFGESNHEQQVKVLRGRFEHNVFIGE
jgi:hypothetical protein